MSPVFKPKDHRTGSEGICETERANCQPPSWSRMTAFPQLCSAQPATTTTTTTIPLLHLLLTRPTSPAPRPPLVTITAWRRMIFQNSITRLSSPDQSRKVWTCVQRFRGVGGSGLVGGWGVNLIWAALFANRKQSKKKKKRKKKKEKLKAVFNLISRAWQALDWDKNRKFPSYDKQFPCKNGLK